MNLLDVFGGYVATGNEVKPIRFRLKGVDETLFEFGIRDGHYIAVPLNKEAYLPSQVGNLVLVNDADENLSYYIDRRDLQK
jgi:hypothetical protein